MTFGILGVLLLGVLLGWILCVLTYRMSFVFQFKQMKNLRMMQETTLKAQKLATEAQDRALKAQDQAIAALKMEQKT